MELVVRKADLLRELQLFQGIVERKNTIPILANVLIEADGEEVKLLYASQIGTAPPTAIVEYPKRFVSLAVPRSFAVSTIASAVMPKCL